MKCSAAKRGRGWHALFGWAGGRPLAEAVRAPSSLATAALGSVWERPGQLLQGSSSPASPKQRPRAAQEPRLRPGAAPGTPPASCAGVQGPSQLHRPRGRTTLGGGKEPARRRSRPWVGSCRRSGTVKPQASATKEREQRRTSRRSSCPVADQAGASSYTAPRAPDEQDWGREAGTADSRAALIKLTGAAWLGAGAWAVTATECTAAHGQPRIEPRGEKAEQGSAACRP